MIKIEITDDIKNIPFFKGKQILIKDNTYLNDRFPSCFKVSCEENTYKLRLPSPFNPNSVIKEA